MAFRFIGLDVKPFLPLFELSDRDLMTRGARRQVADASQPGFPCRVTLEEAQCGEKLLLTNFEHQPANSPYRSSHAIYVREIARKQFDQPDVVPNPMRSRLLSVRAFSAAGMMVSADIVDGQNVEGLICRQLEDREAAYLHVHFAKRGCFGARVERG